MNLAEYQQRQEKASPFHYIVCSETNQRENNEDSFSIYDLYPPIQQQPLKVLSIADGMGGHAYGELASYQALNKVSLALFEQLCISHTINALASEQVIDADRLAQALSDAVKQANAFVWRMAQSNNWGKAGSTIAIAAICDNLAVIVNLGDSPVFHYQKDLHCLKKITDDHTVGQELVRAGKMRPEMARHFVGRSQLKWFVGMEKEKLPGKIPTYVTELAPGDLLLLCTDGVNGALQEKQIEEILSDQESELKVKAQRLIEAALELGETDNQTLILWQHAALEPVKEISREPERAVVPSTHMLLTSLEVPTVTDKEGEDAPDFTEFRISNRGDKLEVDGMNIAEIRIVMKQRKIAMGAYAQDNEIKGKVEEKASEIYLTKSKGSIEYQIREEDILEGEED